MMKITNLMLYAFDFLEMNSVTLWKFFINFSLTKNVKLTSGGDFEYR